MFTIILETTVETRNEQRMIKTDLDILTGPDRWSIDLGDCQKVLRIVACRDITQQIIDVLKTSGFDCYLMDVFHDEDLVMS